MFLSCIDSPDTLVLIPDTAGRGHNLILPSPLTNDPTDKASHSFFLGLAVQRSEFARVKRLTLE